MSHNAGHFSITIKSGAQATTCAFHHPNSTSGRLIRMSRILNHYIILPTNTINFWYNAILPDARMLFDIFKGALQLLLNNSVGEKRKVFPLRLIIIAPNSSIN